MNVSSRFLHHRTSSNLWSAIFTLLVSMLVGQETAAAQGTRELVAVHRYLHFPVKNGAPKRRVQVLADGQMVRVFEVELADTEPEWWGFLDISAWQGKQLVVEVDGLPAESRGLELVEQTNVPKGTDDLYREALRPQFHFSARRGWLNDPNGLVFYEGEYYLFFQHDPYGWHGGMKHWGLAVSRDLVHWREVDEALYPDELGAMWSGSAVVDWKNTSGFGQEGKPPLVLAYTAAGPEFTQCIAYSTDGRKFTKYDGNPAVKQITHGNRDPRVLWHEPTQHWVMTLYVGQPQGHTIHFLTSPNLRAWTVASVLPGGTGGDHFLYECPDFFELPVDGDQANKKWVLTAADSDYVLGSFDGKTFTPETEKLPGHRGRGFYAAQTFSDIPVADGRRIQIGWLHTGTPGMPFNQSMSLPLELSLHTTSDGIRLAWQPAKELAALRAKSHELGTMALAPDSANPLAEINAELIELRTEFEPGNASELRFIVRGVPIIYNNAKQELSVNGHAAPAPLQDGRQRLIVYADRTCIEVFASDGFTYVPMPVNLDPNNHSVEAAAIGGTATIHALTVHELESAWTLADEAPR